MESAERNGSALRRRLRSADRFNEAAMRLGSRKVKTPWSSVSASLRSVTPRDQRRPLGRLAAVRGDEPDLRFRDVPFRAERLRLSDAVAFRAIVSPCKRDAPRTRS
jgi:hypothetical protein